MTHHHDDHSHLSEIELRVRALESILVERAMSIRSPWMRLEWLITPDPVLGGASPIEALRRGNVTEVIEVARSHGAK